MNSDIGISKYTKGGKAQYVQWSKETMTSDVSEVSQKTMD